MADKRTKLLVTDITRDLKTHWNEFREPMALTSIQNRYQNRLAGVFGKGTGFSWLLDELERHRIVKVIITRTGKRWAMPIGAWDGLSEDERLQVKAWCQTAPDARYERSLELREQRLKGMHGVRLFDSAAKGPKQ